MPVIRGHAYVKHEAARDAEVVFVEEPRCRVVGRNAKTRHIKIGTERFENGLIVVYKSNDGIGTMGKGGHGDFYLAVF